MKLDYKVMLRPAYEGYASGAWAASTIAMASVGWITAVPSSAFTIMASLSAAMTIWRGWQTKKVWTYKLSLAGKGFSHLDGREVVQYSLDNPKNFWLGFGFDWQPSHTQMVYDNLKQDLKEIYPPKFFLNLMRVANDPYSQKGLSWLHGIEPDEKIIYTTWENTEGHTCCLGTTGAGKTRLYETLLTQMATRRDAIFVIDPKGDKELKQLCKDICAFLGRPEKFIEFHPAFPSSSIRLDPMKNFNRGTEAASRISSLTSSESGTDTFTAVTWAAIYAISAAEQYLGVLPQLETSRKWLSNGTEKLLEEVIRKFLAVHAPGWQSMIKDIVSMVNKPSFKPEIKGASPELSAAVLFYKKEVQNNVKGWDADVVDNLIRVAEYPRDWHSKMIAGIIPILTMLSSAEVGKMLSPDYSDINDPRPIFDTKKIIEGRYLCYIGLDSLSDVVVGSAIASIILSDLASVAGAIYNYGEKENRIKVQLVIDEAAEVVNAPLIQILNKARGAGFSVTLAAQTYADYVVRMGGEPEARKLLGNCNNMISLRVVEEQTQEFVASKIGETFIKMTSKSHGSGNRTEDHGMQFSGNVTESVSMQKVATFPKELLGKLPDLQYVALLAGGRLVKGRLPKVEINAG